MADFHEIIESCRNGEKSGWSRLFEIYAETIFNSLLSFGADRDLAEDILGDTFIHLMEKGAYRLREATFETESQFQWWLIIIARNLLRSRQRRDKRVVSIGQDVLAASSETIDHAAIHSLPSDLSEIGNQQEVEQALAALTPRERYFIRLHYFKDLKYKEIAELADVTIGSVSSLINRAMGKMKETLQQNGDPNRSDNDEVKR